MRFRLNSSVEGVRDFLDEEALSLLIIRLTGRDRLAEEMLFFAASLTSFASFCLLEDVVTPLSFVVDEEVLNSNMLFGRGVRGVFLRNFTPFDATPLDSPTMLSDEDFKSSFVSVLLVVVAVFFAFASDFSFADSLTVFDIVSFILRVSVAFFRYPWALPGRSGRSVTSTSTRISITEDGRNRTCLSLNEVTAKEGSSLGFVVFGLRTGVVGTEILLRPATFFFFNVPVSTFSSRFKKPFLRE